jgi:hypothetical protein
MVWQFHQSRWKKKKKEANLPVTNAAKTKNFSLPIISLSPLKLCRNVPITRQGLKQERARNWMFPLELWLSRWWVWKRMEQLFLFIHFQRPGLFVRRGDHLFLVNRFRFQFPHAYARKGFIVAVRSRELLAGMTIMYPTRIYDWSNCLCIQKLFKKLCWGLLSVLMD